MDSFARCLSSWVRAAFQAAWTGQGAVSEHSARPSRQRFQSPEPSIARMTSRTEMPEASRARRRAPERPRCDTRPASRRKEISCVRVGRARPVSSATPRRFRPELGRRSEAAASLSITRSAFWELREKRGDRSSSAGSARLRSRPFAATATTLAREAILAIARPLTGLAARSESQDGPGSSGFPVGNCRKPVPTPTRQVRTPSTRSGPGGTQPHRPAYS